MDSTLPRPAVPGLALALGLPLLALAAPRGAASGAPSPDDPVDFVRQVRPILEAKCISCHGPDEEAREADLRLDTREGLFGDLGGYASVVPKKLDESELWLRVADTEDPMPPEGEGEMLTEEELALVRRWIEEGAEWNEEVTFQTHLRPLFEEKCFSCHGADEETREADLRLDTEEAMYADLGGYFSAVPGKLADSEIWLRVSDAEDPMPPEGEGEMLTSSELDLVRLWIEQGAKWEPRVDFLRDVYPVLEAKCFSCHGADERAREADLRLDTKEGLFADLGGYYAVVPEKPDDSELWLRVSDHDDPMPPEDMGEMLTDEELAAVRQWIEQGAEWVDPDGDAAGDEEPSSGGGAPLAARPIDFAREIRPLLSDRCFTCHGPDAATREADLRLDVEDSAKADRGGYRVLEAGDAAASRLLQRVLDDEDPMPPAHGGERLSAEEVELLRAWIDQGAGWGEHWAFVPPSRPEPPAVADSEWPAGDLDRFVLRRLAEVGLAPSPRASRETLLRRATLDLTGLPPTIDELDAYLADDDPGAWERALDRLFASPRYGEEMAREWLDAARYGDTHGLHLDNERRLWRWRDWVIDAFNTNKPFDEFTVEQLAGDLLPDATLDQRIATGFNRCNPTTGEGGLIEEEYRVKYAVDRVDTTATVWMGLTMGCAQCHDHKFDPVSQKEFYSFFGFFNNITESGNDRNALAPPPFVQAPTPEQEEALGKLRARIAAVEAVIDGPMPEVDAAQATWEEEWTARLADRWEVLAPKSATSTGGSSLRVLDDRSVLAEGENPDNDTYEVVALTGATGIAALRLEALLDDSLPKGGPGRAVNANIVLTAFEVEVAPADDPEAFERIDIATASADLSQKDFHVAAAIDGNSKSGWAVDARVEPRVAVFAAAAPFGHAGGSILRVRLRHDSVHVQHAIGRLRLSVTSDPAVAPSTVGGWRSVGPFFGGDANAVYARDFGPEAGVDPDATYGEGDAALGWIDRPEWVDGQVHMLEGARCATYLARTVHAPSAREMELSLGSDDAIAVWLNGAKVLDRNVRRPVAADQERLTVLLREGANELLMKVVNDGGGYGFYYRMLDEDLGGLSLPLARDLGTPATERTDAQRTALRDHYRRAHSESWAELDRERGALRDEETKLEGELAVTMVMEERAEPRPIHLLVRGQYDHKGEELERGVPAVFPPLSEDRGDRAPDRLSLANWLVSGEHPLTARVAVNRIWQRFFGRGLVETSEDFGSQGSPPSHPELLDWLANELVESGWDLRHVQRLILGSATYRQSSRLTAQHAALDPQNRLLARAPRLRLSAEAIRDGALFAGGLLVERVGGPSVRPYQPAGIWNAVAYPSSNTARFRRDSGEALYRRSLYTFWKRTAPPPTMAIFDAPSREACTVRRARTNTPIQALALLNDVQFVEAARALAERVLRESDGVARDAAARAFRLATSRRPRPDEVAILLEVYEAQLDEFRVDAEAARALVAEGESEPDAAFDTAELAAWTAVANLVLNLDETVTRS